MLRPTQEFPRSRNICKYLTGRRARLLSGRYKGIDLDEQVALSKTPKPHLEG